MADMQGRKSVAEVYQRSCSKICTDSMAAATEQTFIQVKAGQKALLYLTLLRRCVPLTLVITRTDRSVLQTEAGRYA